MIRYLNDIGRKPGRCAVRVPASEVGQAESPCLKPDIRDIISHYVSYEVGSTTENAFTEVLF